MKFREYWNINIYFATYGRIYTRWIVNLIYLILYNIQ